MENVQKRVLFSAALTVLSLLNACSGGFGAAPVSFDAQVSPNPLTFAVTVDTEAGTVEYTILEQTLTFASRAGAVGTTVEGYDIEFYEASNNPAFPGDFIQRSSGSLGVYVPPGIVCDELREDDDDEPAFDYCTFNSPGATFARGPARTSPPSYLIPPDIARELFRLVGIGGAVGAYAHVYFYGTDDLQRPFRTEEPYQMAIAIIGGA